MMTKSREQGKYKQEEACARTFLNWLGSQRRIEYELERAEECPELKGRWDFVSKAKGDTQWIALEVKRLVIPQSLRQFGSWSKFCTLVTKELQTRKSVQGSFAILVSAPWIFNQSESKMLAKVFAESMPQMVANMVSGSQVNLGPEIATRFAQWPTEPPMIDNALWHTQHIYKIIHRPKDLVVYKLDDSGCSVEIGPSISEVFVLDPTLSQAILGIFDHQAGKSSKPNEQLGEAIQKGARETFLLLDSHLLWKPNLIAQVMSNIDRAQLSNINAVYLVSVHNNRIQKVWTDI